MAIFKLMMHKFARKKLWSFMMQYLLDKHSLPRFDHFKSKNLHCHNKQNDSRNCWVEKRLREKQTFFDRVSYFWQIKIFLMLTSQFLGKLHDFCWDRLVDAIAPVTCEIILKRNYAYIPFLTVRYSTVG